MGQYWQGVVIKDKTPVVTLSSYAVKEGAKLMEESSFSSPYMLFWEKLLSNEFYGSNFIWCGDYCDGDLYDKLRAMREECANKYADLISSINERKQTESFRYIINVTKRQYVDKNKCENDLHPLPLLCANSNGKGGGDYYGKNMELIGTWAGDKIGMSNDCPDTFEELIPNFEEGY